MSAECLKHGTDLLWGEEGIDYCPSCEVERLRSERDAHARLGAKFMRVCEELRERVTELTKRLGAAEAERDERQRAINQALSALHRTAYVGGPSEREAWRTALSALGPFRTMEQGAAVAAPTAEEDPETMTSRQWC